VLAGVTAAVITLTMMQWGALVAIATGTTISGADYFDGTSQTHDATEISDDSIISLDDSVNGGWYVATGDVTWYESLTVTGNVTLIIDDDVSLNINCNSSSAVDGSAGIKLQVGATLTIYAESDTPSSGGLAACGSASSSGGGGAGIGSDGGTSTTPVQASGAVTIGPNANITAVGGNSNTQAGGAGIGTGGTGGASANQAAVGLITLSTSPGLISVQGGTSDSSRFGAAVGLGGTGTGGSPIQAGVCTTLVCFTAAADGLGGSVVLAAPGSAGPTNSMAFSSAMIDFIQAVISTQGLTYVPIGFLPDPFTGCTITDNGHPPDLSNTFQDSSLQTWYALPDVNSHAIVMSCSSPPSTKPGSAIVITSPRTMHKALLGVNYDLQLTAAGGTKPITWAVTGGALPPGLTLSHSGQITGTPTSTGVNNTFTFTVMATDTLGNAATATFTIDVYEMPTNLTTTLPDGVVGRSYSALLSADGTSPMTWSLVANSGALPPGLTLDPGTGVISGTPTKAGKYTFDVSVWNIACDPQQTLTITISDAPPPTSPYPTTATSQPTGTPGPTSTSSGTAGPTVAPTTPSSGQTANTGGSVVSTSGWLPVFGIGLLCLGALVLRRRSSPVSELAWRHRPDR